MKRRELSSMLHYKNLKYKRNEYFTKLMQSTHCFKVCVHTSTERTWVVDDEILKNRRHTVPRIQ